MGRDRSFCGTNALVSTPVAQSGVGKLANNAGLWTRLKMGTYTNATTSVNNSGEVIQVDGANDSVDPDTVSGGADYPQYSVIKIKGSVDSISGATDCDLPNNMIRFSWPVKDIFGREVQKFDAPYIHLFWLDLPMTEGAASGMQDPWQGAGNTLSGTARPDDDPDLQICVALSELHAGEYVAMDSTSDTSENAWPMLGAGFFQATTGGYRPRMYDCRGPSTTTVYDSAGAVATLRTVFGSIMSGPDEAMCATAQWLKSTATDNQAPQWSNVGFKYLPNDDDFRDVSSTNNIYWTLNIGRTVRAPNTDEQAVVFNLRVASIPLVSGPGGVNDDLLWELISKTEYVAGAGGADGS